MTFASFLISLFVRVLHATLRVRHVHPENITGTPQYILSFWHAHLLLMLHSKFRRPIAVISSRSKDGQISASTFRWFDVEVVRGSSTRGGTAALRQLVRLARDGRNIVFTPDGSKGPARVAKDGVVYAAKTTGLPIIPIAFAAKKKSICARGIAWSSRCRSRRRSFSMESRWSSRVTGTSRNGG
ncbi:MAG TPA: DUF374 domain-containing protein [Thermoanaerobaculia bacterium]|nr:DUF374 domain-containing protein [Thermoanaerobaculia bacterium]